MQVFAIIIIYVTGLYLWEYIYDKRRQHNMAISKDLGTKLIGFMNVLLVSTCLNLQLFCLYCKLIFYVKKKLNLLK